LCAGITTDIQETRIFGLENLREKFSKIAANNAIKVLFAFSEEDGLITFIMKYGSMSLYFHHLRQIQSAKDYVKILIFTIRTP